MTVDPLTVDPHLPLSRLFPIFFACIAALFASAARGEQCLVIGDSLTKEYQAEFPALYPQNPAAWAARNWIEILHQRRNAWFDTGTWGSYVDPRITGHEHNWAFPGATTTEIKKQLNSSTNFWWIGELKGQLKNAVERIVIFAGGNDVDSYYANIYNSNYTGGQTAATFTNLTRDNIYWIVDFIRGQKTSTPIVLVAVPHLGCSPKVQAQCPTDPVKTARVTAALDALNAQLATYAKNLGIGFAPGVYDLTKSMITDPFRIGGIDFYKQADMDSRPRYVFSGDAFHPNTCAQAKIAQLVIQAFRTKYPATNITPLPDSEVITQVLGMDPNIPYNEWVAAAPGVPANKRGLKDDPDGDGLSNLLEFSLAGLSPGTPDSTAAVTTTWTGAGANVQPLLTYTPNPLFLESGGLLKPQQSPDLKTWTDIAASLITTNPDGSLTATLTPSSAYHFLRLKAVK